MEIGVVSGLVLGIAIIQAIRVNIAIFKRFRDPSCAPLSEFYNENLHRIFSDRKGDAVGPPTIVTMLLFGLVLLLMYLGF